MTSPLRNTITAVRVAVLPVGIGHAAAIGLEPGDVAEFRLTPMIRTAGEKAPAPEHRVFQPQPDSGPARRPADLAADRRAPSLSRSADYPGNSRLLLPFWVRPSSSPWHNIGTPLREQQGDEKVALLAPAKLVDGRVVGRPFGATVP